MPDRKLHFFDWEFERIDMLGIMSYVIAHNSFLSDTQVPIKAYQVVEHGQIPEELIHFVEAKKLHSSVAQFRARVFQEKSWVSWQTGIGGVFFKSGTPTHFLPMLDMEFLSTPDIKHDVGHIENRLRSLDQDFSIVRSGDIGRGGYFIVGNEPVVYAPNYWQFMGKALSIFTQGDGLAAVKARFLGNNLAKSTTQEKSMIIADEILLAFPSIKNGHAREGVLCDPRWIGHKVKDGFTILRQSPGKSYDDKPLQVAGYW